MPETLYGSTKGLTKSKEVSLWHERIGNAKKSQENWADESGATRFEKEYKGKFDIVFHARNKKVPIPPINEVFSYVQADVATTYNRDPYITVNPKAGTVLGAKLREVKLNYWWRELKTKEEIECEIIDKDLVGYAWHKVGYAVNSIGTGEQLKIASEKLYSMRLDWRDVLWNIGSMRPPMDCQWMAQRIVRPLEDIKRQYPAAKKLEGVQDPRIDKDSYDRSSYKDDIKVGVMYEIWDAREKQILLLAEGLNDKYLTDSKPWPNYLDEFPFLMYWDFAIPNSSRPMSAIAPWEAQILEEMVLMGQAINHAKRWNRQAFIKAGKIDENALDKFERGDDGAIITVNADVDEKSFRFADFGQLPTDFYLLMDRLQAIKRNINGQPEFVRGGVTKTGTRTVGELQLMEQGVQGRQERKIDRLETHLENIARHMDAHLNANFDFEETIKISGETPEDVIQALGEKFNPVTKTVTFTPEEIKGEYDIEVKAGSTLPLNKQNQTQILETVLQTVASAVSQGPISPFLNALIQMLLDRYDIKGLQEAYKEEVAQAQAAQQAQEGQQSIEDQKTVAEAAKREAQAQQVNIESEILAQDAQIGPVGRAAVKRLEKPDPKPTTNGKK